jgi:dTDP-glucose 4,6-dehydratase
MKQTVRWYLEHAAWVAEVTSGAYRDWVDRNYAQRGQA